MSSKDLSMDLTGENSGLLLSSRNDVSNHQSFLSTGSAPLLSTNLSLEEQMLSAQAYNVFDDFDGDEDMEEDEDNEDEEDDDDEYMEEDYDHGQRHRDRDNIF